MVVRCQSLFIVSLKPILSLSFVPIRKTVILLSSHHSLCLIPSALLAWIGLCDQMAAAASGGGVIESAPINERSWCSARGPSLGASSRLIALCDAVLCS